MPRCQWCRHESATADVCEWCKRPIDDAWTPSAAPSASAAAVPADKMSFVQDDDPDKNDRLLMFSMLGVVLMTILAFAIAHFNKPPASAEAPTPPAVSAEAPATVVEQTPRGEETFQTPVGGPDTDSSGIVQSTPVPKQRYTKGAKSNAKLQIWRSFTSED